MDNPGKSEGPFPDKFVKPEENQLSQEDLENFDQFQNLDPNESVKSDAPDNTVQYAYRLLFGALTFAILLS